MRTLLVISVALSLATGCSKGGDPEKACKHMLDLAHAELEKTIGELEKHGTDMAKGLKEQAEAKRDSDLATCIEKVKEHDIDTGCILKAESLDETQRCLVKR